MTVGLLVACGNSVEPPALGEPSTLSIGDLEAQLAEHVARSQDTSGANTSAVESTALRLSDDRVTLSGRVIDELASPVPGARLAWIEGGAHGLPETRAETLSDSNGTFWLALERAALPAGEALLLSLDAPGRVRRETSLAPARWESDEIVSLGELTLGPGGVVEGRVLDASGAGVSAFVAVSGELEFEEGAPQREWLLYWPLIARLEPGLRPVAGTDETGFYRIAGVPPGRFEVVAAGLLQSAGAASLPAREGGVLVRAGESTRVPDLELRAAAPGELVSGVVLAPEGSPVAGAQIHLGDGERGFPAWTMSSDDGTFVSAAPPDLELVVRALDPEGRWRTVTLSGVRAGGERVVLRFTEEER